MSAYKLDAAQKDMILNKLAELGQVASGAGMQKQAGKSMLSASDKEQIVSSLMRDQSGRGLRRIAYAME